MTATASSQARLQRTAAPTGGEDTSQQPLAATFSRFRLPLRLLSPSPQFDEKTTAVRRQRAADEESKSHNRRPAHIRREAMEPVKAVADAPTEMGCKASIRQIFTYPFGFVYFPTITSFGKLTHSSLFYDKLVTDCKFGSIVQHVELNYH